MNSFPALVLFYLGASQSFVSHALSNTFRAATGDLAYPLVVEITDDRSVRVSRVLRGCTLDLFRERYLIGLVLIPLHKSMVVVGMDRLSPDGEMIDCDNQLVHV